MANELTPVNVLDIDAELAVYSDQIDKALAGQIDRKYFLMCAATAIRRDPAMFNPGSRGSLVAAIFQSAQCQLPVGDGTHRACLVRYGKDVQFQPMYRGLIDLAYRSGSVKDIYAENVFANDKFRYIKGSSPVIEHEPCLTGEKGDYLGTYSVAHTVQGGMVACWIDAAEMETFKKRSKAFQRNSGPWITDENQMRLKTALRRNSKVLPASVFSQAIHSALEIEDTQYKNAREAEVIITHPAPVEGPKTPEEAQAVVDASKPYKAKENEGLEETLTLMLGKLPPDISNKILDKVGISNLAESTDFDAMRKAIPLAEEALINA